MSDQLRKIIGRTPVNICQSEYEISMTFSDGSTCTFYHEQDCCETVLIEDVSGDWSDLLDTPLLVAEERNSDASNDIGESGTWTFYTFRSNKGSVDVRWLGESNGY